MEEGPRRVFLSCLMTGDVRRLDATDLGVGVNENHVVRPRGSGLDLVGTLSPEGLDLLPWVIRERRAVGYHHEKAYVRRTYHRVEVTKGAAGSDDVLFLNVYLVEPVVP